MSKTYKITGRYMEGIKIIGYQLQSKDGESVKIKSETMETMVEQGLITNCKIIKDNGRTYIKGIGMRISELPVLSMLATDKIAQQSSPSGTISSMEIVGRMLDGDTVIGYIIKDSTGADYRLPIDKVWELTREGAISNAKAQISGSNKLLLGKGYDLRSLPVTQVGEH